MELKFLSKMSYMASIFESMASNLVLMSACELLQSETIWIKVESVSWSRRRSFSMRSILF